MKHRGGYLPLKLAPGPPGFASPAQGLYVAVERVGEVWEALCRRPSARLCGVLPCAAQFLLGCLSLGLGLAAFTFTGNYRVGSFWVGPLMIGSSVFSLAAIGAELSMDEEKFNRRYRRTLAVASMFLNILLVMATLSGAVLDTIGAYLIVQTDLSMCDHTQYTITTRCSREGCGNLAVPANTCYCCHLYKEYSSGCDAKTLLTKQAYYTGVRSCDELYSKLVPMLLFLALFNVASTVTNFISVFTTTPDVYSSSRERRTHKKHVNSSRRSKEKKKRGKGKEKEGKYQGKRKENEANFRCEVKSEAAVVAGVREVQGLQTNTSPSGGNVELLKIEGQGKADDTLPATAPATPTPVAQVQ